MPLLDRYDGLIVDLDGVVFRVEEPIEPAIEFLCRVEMPFVFVTNNAARKHGDWVEMLAAAGVEVAEERVLTSPMAAVAMLHDDPPTRVYPIGEEGLTATLATEGVPTTDSYEDADAVLVGWDRHLTWDKLRIATLAIHRGARFIGTNGDLTYPAPEGPWPGNGAALAFLHAATNVTAEIAGKPETPMFELAAERLGGGSILVVGDKIPTDIQAAERLGWDSVLALTGASSWESLIGAVATPTWVISDLGELDGPQPTRVREAGEGDLPRLRELVSRVCREVDAPFESPAGTWVAEDPDGGLVAAVGWEERDEAVVVRWIVHDSEHEDAGAHVLARALDKLGRAEVSCVYRLGEAAADLFERLGFEPLAADQAPETLREATRPDANVLMRHLESERSER